MHNCAATKMPKHLYDIDGEEFSKEAFDARYQTYQSQYTEVTYMTRDEIETQRIKSIKKCMRNGNSLRDTAAASAPDRRSPESCDTADF